MSSGNSCQKSIIGCFDGFPVLCGGSVMPGEVHDLAKLDGENLQIDGEIMGIPLSVEGIKLQDFETSDECLKEVCALQQRGMN